ncbi:unnamed protein product [Psylliodes chrysocephalus]|uniref:Uncharacterized protein n=1 Tax=Psylliodes chrysocephalus TaxID=3402493 RepID=A0A9P0GC36_9CUCU|nr:unnamed protein product [Psylliodes chrysocephala]
MLAIEDADSLIVQTVIELALSFSSVFVIGGDVDLLVLLTDKSRDISNIYLRKPDKGKKEDVFYSPQSLQYSDTVAKNVIQVFYDHNAELTEVVAAGKLFMLRQYDAEREYRKLDSLRYTYFVRAVTKKSFNLAALPPTSDVCHQQIRSLLLSFKTELLQEIISTKQELKNSIEASEARIALSIEKQNRRISNLEVENQHLKEKLENIERNQKQVGILQSDLIAIGCDGTAVNTGSKGGVIRLLALHLKRPLQWLKCQLHAIWMEIPQDRFHCQVLLENFLSLVNNYRYKKIEVKLPKVDMEKPTLFVPDISKEKKNKQSNYVVRKFEISRFNFNAEKYFHLINWQECTITEPSMTKHLTDKEIQDFIETGNLLVKNLWKLPCHTQAVERGVKLATEASLVICGHNNRDGWIRTTIASRKTMPKYDTKSDYLVENNS